MKKFISILIVGSLLAATCVWAEENTETSLTQEKGVIVKTNKTIYKDGDKIKISISNNSQEEIFYLRSIGTDNIVSLNTEKKISGTEWEMYLKDNTVATTTNRLNPNKTISTKWHIKLQKEGPFMNNTIRDTGTYRVKFQYFKNNTLNNENSHVAYSDAFYFFQHEQSTVKNKSVIISIAIIVLTVVIFSSPELWTF